MLHTDDFDVSIEETVTLYTFTELQAYYALHTTTRRYSIVIFSSENVAKIRISENLN